MTDYHLAQLNIGRVRAPIGSPLMADFEAMLDPINALADAAPGFVWRLQAENGNSTEFRPYDDDMILMNMSVWTSVEALRDFAYRTAHLDVIRRRREWFERMVEQHAVLWWLPAGELPTIAEAVDRLERLRRHGPGPEAFTFKEPYPAPGSLRVRRATPAAA